MKTFEIRKCFLEFFKEKGHRIVKSDSLIPKNDPTLLFTGAGMNQFKEYFLGLRTDLKRAASSQKCLRTGDLDQVGKTPYHHSFFEMLGNFSFGDYFKEEAIEWAWTFLTQEMRLPQEKLYVSVHKKDEEALDIWVRKIGIPKKLIARLGDGSNFWPANAPQTGPNGPCGPCSEIFFDQGETYPGATKKFWAEDESGRYAEIWNLVFTQFERQEGGKLVPLQSKNIDTGMGLERLACIMQGKQNNFDTDLFVPLIRVLKSQAPGHESLNQSSLNAIADHIRAAVVAIADGAHPANDGRGYVIRKLIRRAVWQGRSAELETPLLAPLVPVVITTLKDVYPELSSLEKSIAQTVSSEEERFRETLESGLEVLTARLKELREKKNKILPGEEVFRLYDTYGFPDELTRTIAKQSGIQIDEKKFEALLSEQRKRAKASSKLADRIFATPEINQDLLKLPETRFLGYQTLEADAKILWANFSGEMGAIALDQTPFYPEGGGQVGDVGVLEGKNFILIVSDTQKKERAVLHYGKLKKGKPKAGDSCRAQVDRDKRDATKRNHTATHLLQAALRTVIGTHVRQVGSLVSPERLRFDFTCGKPLTSEEIGKVEAWVNRTILENAAVESKEENYDSAIQSGVLAFFGDKYGDRVRVIEVPGKSKELCGGTHCRSTGEIGAFVITTETSIGSGTRRMEATTGLNAIRYVKDLQQTVAQIALALKTSPDQTAEKIGKLQKKVRELERSGGSQAKSSVDTSEIDDWLNSAKSIGKMKLITQTLENESIASLRHLADQLRSKAQETVFALFGVQGAKVNLIVGLSKDLTASPLNAKEMAQKMAPLLSGSAGGRKDLAQGGGTNAKGIQQAVLRLSELIRKTVGK
ncbi:MAG: alanine--tRNA ligase [Candidatus Omnitrophica bacterium]|nr:alanine--tRNA ligase [Candidatus Omnitrophota bacterium]